MNFCYVYVMSRGTHILKHHVYFKVNAFQLYKPDVDCMYNTTVGLDHAILFH